MVHLHSGKITVEDCLRLSEKNLISEEKIKIPYFMKNLKNHHSRLHKQAGIIVTLLEPIVFQGCKEGVYPKTGCKICAIE